MRDHVPEVKIHVYRYTLQKYSDMLDSARDEHEINSKGSLLHQSYGEVINGINECIKAYNGMCAEFNELFESTSNYVRKAASNIAYCEDINSERYLQQ